MKTCMHARQNTDQGPKKETTHQREASGSETRNVSLLSFHKECACNDA
jgi:hypothetical protein